MKPVILSEAFDSLIVKRAVEEPPVFTRGSAATRVPLLLVLQTTNKRHRDRSQRDSFVLVGQWRNMP